MRCLSAMKGCFVAATAILMLAVPLRAQEYQAKITGTVMDSSKAAIPNATIQVHDLDTGQVITVKTNGLGIYTVPYLHPGQHYAVSATATGFEKAEYPATALSLSQVLTANFSLRVGGTAQEVTINSESYS